MTRSSRQHRARRVIVRSLCVAAAMAAAVVSTNAFAQATGAQSGSAQGTSVTSDSTTASGSTSRTDNPVGRDASRHRSRIGTKPSGEYVPRTGSSSHRDKHGNVVKDQSTGGSPQGRERPPASPPNIPATQP